MAFVQVSEIMDEKVLGGYECTHVVMRNSLQFISNYCTIVTRV